MSDVTDTLVVNAGRELAELIEEAQRQGACYLDGLLNARRVPAPQGTFYEMRLVADDGSALKITVEAV